MTIFVAGEDEEIEHTEEDEDEDEDTSTPASPLQYASQASGRLSLLVEERLYLAQSQQCVLLTICSCFSWRAGEINF